MTPQIPNYEIKRVLGEGGMAVCYYQLLKNTPEERVVAGSNPVTPTLLSRSYD